MSRMVLASLFGTLALGICSAAPKPANVAGQQKQKLQQQPQQQQKQQLHKQQQQQKQAANHTGEQHLIAALHQTQAAAQKHDATAAQAALQSLAAAVQAFDSHHKAAAGKGQQHASHPHIQSAVKHLQAGIQQLGNGNGGKAAKGVGQAAGNGAKGGNHDFHKAAAEIQTAIQAHAAAGKK